MYEELTAFVDQLPLNEQSAAYPFSGLVLNIGVSTQGHRDSKDKRICVVMPFGDWKGGELCLFEAGIVLKLHPGDVVIFRSCDITHFNLTFEGLRASLVLHTDKGGDQWVSNRNGYGWPS